jgi:hypothetical protein
MNAPQYPLLPGLSLIFFSHVVKQAQRHEKGRKR